MSPFWVLIVLPLAFTVHVHIQLHLKCERMYTTETHVFLMEEDGGHDNFLKIFDPDDVLARGNVTYNKETEVLGDDDEIGDLEPYLFILNRCTETTKDFRIDMPPATYRKNYYQINVDLDKHEATVAGPSNTPMNKLG